MSRELEDKLEAIGEELNQLQNHDELSDTNEGILIAAEDSVMKAFTRQRNARHLSEWDGR